MDYISESLDDTKKIAFNFAEGIKSKGKQALIVGLYGELGSGKTTFMKYLAEALGVRETIQSPTFVIMKSFNLSNLQLSNFRTLVHIDAYRIEKPEEMLNLSWERMISDPKNLIFIEWPERVAEILPEHIMVRFEHGQNEGQRSISIA